jgi:hypothetical protein
MAHEERTRGEESLRSISGEPVGALRRSAPAEHMGNVHMRSDMDRDIARALLRLFDEDRLQTAALSALERGRAVGS